jgi:hypothetical protein
VKRYSLSISPFAIVPASVDRVLVKVGVLSEENASYPITAFDRDGVTLSHGVAVPSYVGTNSVVQIQRGADGLGTRTLRVVAYVEVEP